MKIALCTSFSPFCLGGARNIVDWLELTLLERGHQVEKICLPHVDDPKLLFNQMASYRWVNLPDSIDKVICFRPPAHVIPHPNKVLWFIHHIRAMYDLWGSKYCPMPNTEEARRFRKALISADTAALNEAKKVFTNSKVVSQRLGKYNNVQSKVLYPPLFQAEKFHYARQNDEILYLCRVEDHKRQHLLVEAMAHTRTAVKLRIAGVSGSPRYVKRLRSLIKKHGLSDRVVFNNCYVSEEEKIELYASCLAVAYLPLDEDSYGYPSLEASYSCKPIITTTDAGGVLELVQHNTNGYVCEPDPKALAAAMDELYSDRDAAKKQGVNARQRIEELDISWDNVVESLLS